MRKMLKYNKPFPYRELGEMLTLDEIAEIFNDSLFYGDESYRNINNRLARFFYNMYSKRYPFEQSEERLKLLILQIKDTYIDSFYNNILRSLGNENLSLAEYKRLMTKGNGLKYETKSGTSASPYNIAFNQIGEIFTNDNLMEKNLSETSQHSSNEDIVKRSGEIAASKMNGEVLNFLNSFYSLFSNINLTEYIERELNSILNAYRDRINNIIEAYNELQPFLEEWRKGRNDR